MTKEKIRKQIKIFGGNSSDQVENKVNQFISDKSIKLIDVQFVNSNVDFAVMVVYEEV